MVFVCFASQQNFHRPILMTGLTRYVQCIVQDLILKNSGRKINKLRIFMSTSRTQSSCSYDNISSLTELYRRRDMAKRPSLINQSDQMFDYFLVLDFEATCDNKERLNPQEIIEFPVLKFNAMSQKVDSVFHHYVLPQYHPLLTPFCTQLTGIVQEMINDQPTLPLVLQNFDQWMMSEGLLNPEVRSIFVTCGDWDLKTMLPRQCALLNIPHKPYFHRWINLKKSYADVTRTFPKGMMDMLAHLGLKHVGHHHSGIDDCHNISSILKALIQKGYVFKENGRL